MATDKTPAHKRIQRAEEGREDWKVKALERRIEIEKLRMQLTTKENHLVNSKNLQNELKKELNNANKKIRKLEEDFIEFKKKTLNDFEKPFKHRYSTKIIKLAIDLHGEALLGPRKISRVLKTVFRQFNIPAPHHATIRQWINRCGLYKLQAPLEQSNDWIAIGDVTIDVGKMKCFTILGVQMNKLSDNRDLTLSHRDIEVLGIYPSPTTKHEFICNAFEEASKRVGGFLGIVTDQGADIKKGAQTFIEKLSQRTKTMYDIPHKLSLLLKHEFKRDVKWADYMQDMAKARNLMLQTDLAAFLPPTPRLKERFMDLGKYITWSEKILESKENNNLSSISEERYKKYFGWIEQYKPFLEEWGFMIGIGETTKDIIREYGMSKDVYQYLEIFLSNAPIEGNRLKNYVLNVLKLVKEETDKLEEGQTLICSTEILESLFGKYKAINNGKHGITGSALSMAAFTLVNKADDFIKRALESYTVKSVTSWIKEKTGQSIASIRRACFPIKRTKFDNVFGMPI